MILHSPQPAEVVERAENHGIFMLTLAYIHHLDQVINRVMSGLDWPLEGFVRLLLAGICGGLVGLEREVRGRPAGFRTYLLVALGSALTMVVSENLAMRKWESPGNAGVNINVDPGRIAYGVMTGIGFIGAGVIIQHKGSIRGLTTSASLWCVASVGLAAGFGLYLIAFFATALIVTALWLLDYLEDVVPRQRFRIVTVRAVWSVDCVSRTVTRFKAKGFSVIDSSFKRSADLKTADIDLNIAFRSGKHYREFEHHLTSDSEYELLAAKDA